MRRVVAGLVLMAGAQAGWAERELSFGFGMGALYSGLGGNVGMRSETSFGYLSAGCVTFAYSRRDGWATPCGIGAGWIETDLLANGNRRHGFGLYVGPVGAEESQSGGDYHQTRYGVGFTYAFFFSGETGKGWNAGVTPAVGVWNSGAKGALLINAGYQF